MTIIGIACQDSDITVDEITSAPPFGAASVASSVVNGVRDVNEWVGGEEGGLKDFAWGLKSFPPISTHDLRRKCAHLHSVGGGVTALLGSL